VLADRRLATADAQTDDHGPPPASVPPES